MVIIRRIARDSIGLRRTAAWTSSLFFSARIADDPRTSLNGASRSSVLPPVQTASGFVIARF